jgi:hypothetical protein
MEPANGGDDAERLADGAVIESLIATLRQILPGHPAGLTEHQLFGHLAATGVAVFSRHSIAAPLGLFRAHFLLFHCLYLLRDRLLGEAAGELEIHCTCIVVRPYRRPESVLPDRADPLRSYYLDLARLRETTAQEVRDMLTGFWARLRSWDKRSAALKVLGLEDPVDIEHIRRRHHELALVHHPDRGGDAATLSAINAAVQVLKGGRS